VSRLPPDALSYRDLSAFSLHFDRVDFARRPPALNVLVPSAAPDAIFAGIRTALTFARRVALELDRPLRIVTFNPRGAPGDRRNVEARLGQELDVARLELVRLGDGEVVRASPDDAWIVTFWTTAHAADVARRLGLLDPRRVAYLVQDYEPGFQPWSSNHVLIRATYHAGFALAVNSSPLARHLEAEERVSVSKEFVFAPDLDLARLERAAAARRPAERVRVFFYARPSKPRNLFAIGVAALRRADDMLGSARRDVEVVAAGEPMGELALGHGRRATVLGRVGWAGYYDLLSRADLGLSLMYSPHPSHPPLELATSGAWAITNDFAGARTGLHPRLVAPRADPDELAAALVDAVARVRDDPTPEFAPIEPGLLGIPVDQVAARCAAALES
jgi:WsaF, C-terminal domain/WsaF, N-terminal domain